MAILAIFDARRRLQTGATGLATGATGLKAGATRVADALDVNAPAGSLRLAGMSDTIQIHVLAFGSAVDALGWSSKELSVPSGAKLSAVIDQLCGECERLAAARDRVRYAVNQAFATEETPLKSGDEVAIVPPVSGGALPVARLVRERISVGDLVREVENPGVGGIATFVGVVRYEANADGRGLKGLEYEAFEPMALSEMSRICETAAEKYTIHKILAVHRLGRLRVGDVSVVVVVSAAHRGDAFDACRFVIDELKKAAPIFKKEVWHDASSTWVDGI